MLLNRFEEHFFRAEKLLNNFIGGYRPPSRRRSFANKTGNESIKLLCDEA